MVDTSKSQLLHYLPMEDIIMQHTLDTLNAYMAAANNGDNDNNIWQDVIYSIDRLDLDASDKLGAIATSDVFVADGITYGYNHQAATWQVEP